MTITVGSIKYPPYSYLVFTPAIISASPDDFVFVMYDIILSKEASSMTALT
ncbi:MAG: hypothetical protein IPH69_06505 [Bacteroidales bacterium]|nr:hypothetical protein [Bacteroidales bacterium]